MVGKSRKKNSGPTAPFAPPTRRETNVRRHQAFGKPTQASRHPPRNRRKRGQRSLASRVPRNVREWARWSGQPWMAFLGERVTRLELATSSLARRCSTTELHPHFERKGIIASHLPDARFLSGRKGSKMRLF